MTSAESGQASGASLRLEIFTDGCYDPQSETGGWALVAYRDGLEVATSLGGTGRSSNNALELLALLEAAVWANGNAMGESAILWTDSVYVVNGCNQWRHIWKSRGWRKKGLGSHARSRAIANAELWKAMDEALSQNTRLKVEWCKGHSGVAGNEKADRLAELGRSRSMEDAARNSL